MFCKNCGREVDDNTQFCPNCGAQVNAIDAQPVNTNSQSTNPAHEKNKSTAGVLLALFLGLIGLIIGLCLYPDGTVARKTFIKAWVITYVVEFVVGFILGIILAVSGVDTEAYYSCLMIR
jgi:uncharacterized membrane protein YvbJ